MYQYNNDKIYIAGPECFYPNGYDLWDAFGKKAQYYGFGVTMPTTNTLDLTHADPRENADEIFRNCAFCMNQSTAIIADLETFRGAEPDGGSLFEIGMAYAQGLRCYGFTRDKRDMTHKYQAATLQDGVVCDAEGRILSYGNLPFCPSLIGSSKIIEGSFDDALKLLMLDIDESRKAAARPQIVEPVQESARNHTRPLAYLVGPERYDSDAAEQYARMKALCDTYGFDAVSPLDDAPGVERVATDDAYTKAQNDFDRWTAQVRGCDLILANLSDFHGWEPNNDTSFECGMAWQLGKKCYGFMPDTAIMCARIPRYGAEKNDADLFGNIVENFDYPINLMFASSMNICEGDFEVMLQSAAKEFETE